MHGRAGWQQAAGPGHRHRPDIGQVALDVPAAAVAAVALGVVKVNPVSLAKGTAWIIASMAVLYFAWILLFGGLDTVEKKRVGAIIVLSLLFM